jgi:antitoxin component YwqK of YwqJK toxin-antitoxin module
MLKSLSFCIAILLLTSCASRTQPDNSAKIVSMQIIDRHGFTETISSKDRLASYQKTDFLAPQPYQKVLCVYGRKADGHTTSKITSYHDNSQIWQYLDVVNGRANGLYAEWFPNGQKKIEAHVVEGPADINDISKNSWIFDGPSKVWDEEGNLLAEINYEKGLLHSPSIYYYPNATVQKIIPYHEGEINGLVQIFDDQGALVEQISHVNGKRQGHSFGTWDKDQYAYQEEYDNDLLMQASYFSPSGTQLASIKEGAGQKAEFKERRLYSLISYSNGIPDGEVRIFRADGSLHSSYIISNGMKQGEEWEYYPSGEKHPKICLHWNEDLLQGQVRTWYENGTMESQREINNNKKQGLCFAWYKNGDLMLAEEYENDMLTKGTYYKKGDKTPVSRIDSGKGEATLYTSEGIYLRKTSYEKGRPIIHDKG